MYLTHKVIIMKYVLVFLLCFAGFTSLQAQSTISLDSVKTHVGDSVRVCGKVFSTRFLESANGTPTLINLGGAFPNEKLTVVIFGENRNAFQVKPEEAWKDKEICVTGRIVEYKGKPQIVVARPEQVEVKP
jgi:micrococcal nuclease